jgi:hypothetical protein
MSEIQEKLRLSPVRALIGCLIGALAGFGPVPSVGPGLWVTLVVLFLLLRAPLVPTLGVGIVAKLLALVATPIAYQVGVFLLDGPTSSFFAKLINAPFTALFGLEYYTVTGGLGLGLILGLVATPMVLRMRTKTTDRRRPGIVRPTGIIVSIVLLAALWFMQSSAAQGILTTETSNILGKLNGATVDVAGVNLDLAESSLTISDMAFANPKALSTNLFHGLELSANLASHDLLRKRLHIERLVVRRAESGVPRAVPGVLIGAPSPPEVEPPAEGEKGIDDYLKDWEVWKDRLGQAREWVEKLAKNDDDESTQSVADAPLDTLIATELIDDAPMLLVSEFLVEGLTFDWLAGESLTLGAHNLSSQPSLVDGAMDLTMSTESDLFQMSFALPSASDPGMLTFALRGLSVDSVASMLRLGKGSGISGGTLDLSLSGPWSGGRAGYVDLPLEIKLHDIELALGGSQKFPISELVLPVQLKGPIDSPNVRIDTSALTESLRAAGAAELTKFIDTKKAELIGKGKAELQEKVGSKLGDLLGKDVELDPEDLEKTKAELQAAAKEKLADEAKAQAEELLGDKAQPLLDALEGAKEDGLEGLTEKAKDATEAAKKAATEKAKEKGKEALGKKFGELFGGKKKDGR